MSPTHVIAYLALVLSLAPRTFAQPASGPFSLPRIGDVIDADEQRYFGLFPDYMGGTPLRLERAGPDVVQAIGEAEGQPSYRVRFSAGTADALGDLISRYETIYLARAKTFEPPAVAGLVLWRRPFRDSSPPVVVTRRSGDDVRGVVVHADEYGLVLSTRNLPFHDILSAEGLLWIPAADVLRVRRNGLISQLDLRPSGDLARYERSALPVLQREALFVRGLSPELAAWQRTALLADPPPAENALNRDYSRLPLSRWSLSVQYAQGAIDAGSTTAHLFARGGTVTNTWSGTTANARGRVEYAVTPTVGMGVAVEQAGTGEISGIGLDTRRLSALTVDLTGSFAVVPPRLRVPYVPSVTVRAGGSVARTVSETTLAYYWENRDYTATSAFTDRAVEIGGVAGVEAAFRLSRRASVTFGYDAAVYPWAAEEARELYDPRINLVIKTIDARSFNVRRGGATVGFSVHLGGP